MVYSGVQALVGRSSALFRGAGRVARRAAGRLPRSAGVGAAALLLASTASATWSIVVVNTKTGEVGIFAATCINNLNLERVLGMIRVGEGAAAIQFAGDPNVRKRRYIWAEMELGRSPEEILLGMQSAFADINTLQIGMASTFGSPTTFTGTGVWDPNFGVQGTVGDLRYAIQGNVITGAPVVLEAEAALLATEGDLTLRLTAAMEASRLMGGDGRCSCDDGDPGGCGSPPNVPFDRTAGVSFLIVARMGDVDGDCDDGIGCTNGDYYLERRVTQGGASARDAVTRLLDKVRIWEQGLVGAADHLLTEVHVDRGELVADGQSTARVTVRLRDRNGVALAAGGQSLLIEAQVGATATVGPVTDNGDGTHTFELTATDTPGAGEWHVTVNDGVRDVLLWPALTLETAPLADLHASRSTLGAAGPDVVLTLNLAGQAGAPYRILGSASGQVPGTVVSGVAVPLNPDRFFGITMGAPRGPVFTGFGGLLDSSGRAEAGFGLSPQLMTVLAGTRFDFAGLVGDPQMGPQVTGAVSVDVAP